MAERNSADIVFVLDSSKSMQPCIEGVKNHISSFVDVLKGDANGSWDLRLDFLAHRDSAVERRAAGVDRDFRERVIAAGGEYDDVDVRASLMWHNRNDLDLHVVTPRGERIYFGAKKSSCKGELDVDRNVRGETSAPVENIRWRRGEAPWGTYVVQVMNYRFHEPTKAGYDYRVEVVNGGEVLQLTGNIASHMEGTQRLREVARFTYDPTTPRASGGAGGFEARTVFNQEALGALYTTSQARFFTSDLSEFQSALDRVDTGENEAPLLALDCALDFPWRPKHSTHRIVVFLTDEAVEGGNRQEQSLGLIPRLIEKIHALKVLLFLVTPESRGFEQLSEADKCEWEVVEGGDGLQSVDFQELLVSIAKSISKSQTPLGAPPPTVDRALFGQDA